MGPTSFAKTATRRASNNLTLTDAPQGTPLRISTPSSPDTLQDTKLDTATEWIQSAMQTSKEMHRNEDFRREVSKRLF